MSYRDVIYNMVLVAFLSFCIQSIFKEAIVSLVITVALILSVVILARIKNG